MLEYIEINKMLVSDYIGEINLLRKYMREYYNEPLVIAYNGKTANEKISFIVKSPPSTLKYHIRDINIEINKQNNSKIIDNITKAYWKLGYN